MWITSKLWCDAHAPADVAPAVEKTLSDLQLEYLDLYLIHWPVAFRKGLLFPRSVADMIALDDIPLAETWTTMETLVDKGLCRHIGVSNFSIAKLQGLLDSGRRKPEMNQIELHPYLQQPDMLTFCRRSGIFVTAYSPLGSFDRPSELKAPDEPVLLDDPTIAEVAERHGITPAQVLVSWAIQRGTVVIPKSIHPGRMKQNLDAAEIALTPEDMQTIAGLNRNRRYVNGEFWTRPGSPYTLASLWDE
jgi:alcohol dehydrogenase (NADP+)